MSTIIGFDLFWGVTMRRVACVERRTGIRASLPVSEDTHAWLRQCADDLGVSLATLLRQNTVELNPKEWRQEDHGDLEDALERALEVDAMDPYFATTLVNTIDDFIQAQAEEWFHEGKITMSRAAELMGCSLEDARACLVEEGES